jgi:hypothetical protein
MSAAVEDDLPVRYLRLPPGPERILEITASYRGTPLARHHWRASNLFGGFEPVSKAWRLPFTLDEVLPGSRLAIAVHGSYGPEKATAALRVGDTVLGAPVRAPSYPANSWEVPPREVTGNSCHLFPLDVSMIGQPLEAVLLLLEGGSDAFTAEAWITHPDPYVKQRIVIGRTSMS